MDQMEALIFVEVSQGQSTIEIAKAISSDEKVTEVLLISGHGYPLFSYNVFYVFKLFLCHKPEVNFHVRIPLAF